MLHTARTEEEMVTVAVPRGVYPAAGALEAQVSSKPSPRPQRQSRGTTEPRCRPLAPHSTARALWTLHGCNCEFVSVTKGSKALTGRVGAWYWEGC